MPPPPLAHASFVPTTTFLPHPLSSPLTSRRFPFPSSTPRASAAPPSPDHDFFIPRDDLNLLNSGRLSSSTTSRPARQPLSVGELRAKQKRSQLTLAPKSNDDDDEKRRVQVVEEELTAADLLGIVDVARGPSVGGGRVADPFKGGGVENAEQPVNSVAVPGEVLEKDGDGVARFAPGKGREDNNEQKGRDGVGGTPLLGEAASSGKKSRWDSFKDKGVLRHGQLVLHQRHGVGRFRGIERTVSSAYDSMNGNSRERPVQEFAVLEYRDGDVYVPLSHLEVIRRLTEEEIRSVTKLDVMSGSTGYSLKTNAIKARRAKYVARAKTRQKIRKQLVDLHGLYAQRTSLERDPFPVDHEAEKKFDDGCSFQLTNDQRAAVMQVYRDMSESRTPMDRLLCGDVGFGKTEVAIRAAFRAIRAGKQVAVLAPTTILAHQHFETFSARFEGVWPDTTTHCLTRFMKRKAVTESKELVRTGGVNIVIGTHILLSDSFKFHNIGLLIVDEEHRFGVNQKEKIRDRYRGVDALYLSATPIPRTLHLALSGLRDASVLRTPPFGRKPVITKLHPNGAGVVRRAIQLEIDRNGQVFFVVPRIDGIEDTANWVRDLFPKLRVLVAHGQCPDLERRIWAFSQHEYDVLICTTIIENGINMPDVNTVIIQDAGRFGLAQLHQLRGRVGRSDIQAYAWMLYTHHPFSRSSNSMNRLLALEKNSALGSGFAIAQRDMEMRGVGTVLGVEQHGNSTIDADEYAQMLAEELESARTNEPVPISLPEPVASTEVLLPVASMIPDSYISDLDEKMIVYSALSNARTQSQLLEIIQAMEQQFGPLPSPTRRHVSILELKLCAKLLGITRIFAERQHVVIDWRISEEAFKKLAVFLPNEQAKNRCRHIFAEERIFVRGLGICSGDVQLTTLRSYIGCIRKAAAMLSRKRPGKEPADSANQLANKLYQLDNKRA